MKQFLVLLIVPLIFPFCVIMRQFYLLRRENKERDRLRLEVSRLLKLRADLWLKRAEAFQEIERLKRQL